MKQDIEKAKQAFRHLLDRDASHMEIIDLLLPFHAESDLPVDDKGWVMWNLCDRFAMLRDAQNQFRYQSEFHEWSKTSLPSLRFHWVVSDGTQAFTLIQGGFLEFWWQWYEFANAHCPRVADNRTVRFESHRANAAAYTHFAEIGRAESALNAIEGLLLEDTAWPNRDFAAATFRTLMINFYGVQGKTNKVVEEADQLVRELDAWLSHARGATETTHEEPLLGSWDQLNGSRPPAAVYVAIHNAAIALAETKQFDHAERLFRARLDERRALTSYGQSQYVLACWENRHDTEEIKTLLQQFGGIPSDKLKQWAPALNEALTSETGT
jgi:hypothetical protein